MAGKKKQSWPDKTSSHFISHRVTPFGPINLVAMLVAHLSRECIESRCCTLWPEQNRCMHIAISDEIWLIPILLTSLRPHYISAYLTRGVFHWGSFLISASLVPAHSGSLGAHSWCFANWQYYIVQLWIGEPQPCIEAPAIGHPRMHKKHQHRGRNSQGIYTILGVHGCARL